MAITSTSDAEVAAVAERVREAITECGVQRTWLCQQTGIPESTMRRRLAGASPFNVAELSRIAAALRLRTQDFLADRSAA